jgi:tetratricopeptide (TPR) repeat protein
VQASALYELDRLDEAFVATEKSEAAGSEDDVVTQAYWRAERAKVLARWGRGEAAMALVRRAVDLIDATDGLLEQADVYVALGEVNRVLGRRDEARAALLEAVGRYETKGAQPFVAQTRGRLDRLAG